MPTSNVLFAALDLGSNSFRLELARFVQGRYKRLDYLKRPVRLGAGLDDNGYLTAEAFERGLDCLRLFADRLLEVRPDQIRAVATQTLREARNRDDFLAQAQEILGFPIEVIPGREEARLIYQGVAHLQPAKEVRLVIDIGGRSTEVVLGQSRRVLRCESIPLGSVSQSQRFFASGELSAQAFQAARVAATAAFEDILSLVQSEDWQACLGSSGTIGAVADILLASGLTDGTVTPQALDALTQRCIAARTLNHLELPGLRDDRRPVLAGGISILAALMQLFGIRELQAAKGALRQGVIVELSDRLSNGQRAATQDVRVSAVKQTQRRFAVDLAQAERVRRQALIHWDSLALKPESDPQGEHRMTLAWACDWHELGLFVSHEDHHRHGAYVTQHLDVPGFSKVQLHRISRLILSHRGGLRKVQEDLVDPVMALQALCIRLAALACHARDAAVPVPLPWSVRRTAAQRIVIRWLPLPADRDPELAYLLSEELHAWSRVDALKVVLEGS